VPSRPTEKFTRNDLLIRRETPADVSAIAAVTVAAFSRHTEQLIIAALRAANALTLSLVAEVQGRVVGHIAFSPVTISDGCSDWYGLGPVSVLPEYQHQGIGSALIWKGLARLKSLHAKGCCLVDHRRWYLRFGFRNIPKLVHKGVPRKAFLALPFIRSIPKGRVTFHEAFKTDGQQTGAGGA